MLKKGFKIAVEISSLWPFYFMALLVAIVGIVYFTRQTTNFYVPGLIKDDNATEQVGNLSIIKKGKTEEFKGKIFVDTTFKSKSYAINIKFNKDSIYTLTYEAKSETLKIPISDEVTSIETENYVVIFEPKRSKKIFIDAYVGYGTSIQFGLDLALVFKKFNSGFGPYIGIVTQGDKINLVPGILFNHKKFYFGVQWQLGKHGGPAMWAGYGIGRFVGGIDVRRGYVGVKVGYGVEF